MGRKNHDWKIGQEPPLIRPHSLAKHRVLRSYLEQYVKVLTSNPRQEQFRLTLIDGFAGGGRYLDSRTKEERSGSPLIMLEAMEKAAQECQNERSKPFNLDVQFIFIEKDPDALAYLRETLLASRFAKLIGDKIQIVPGDFISNIAKTVEFVKQRGRANRAIYVLDQFGYVDVPFSTIREILATLDNAEIMLTLATDFLIDYLTDSPSTQKVIEKAGLALSPAQIATAKENRDWRRCIQRLLHREIVEKTGAAFYTPFFIRSADSHRDFWLVHLSGHFRARDVMVGLHWKENNCFAHYGGAGLGMLGYDERDDSGITKQSTLPGFFFDETALLSSQYELTQQRDRTQTPLAVKVVLALVG